MDYRRDFCTYLWLVWKFTW